MNATTALTIPDDLMPADGRFGCGPSKVRPEQLAAPRERRRGADGHLAPPDAREGARRAGPRGPARAVPLPDGYEVALGNGGTTAFWDAAAFGLVRERSLHLVFGEFSAEVRHGDAGAPFLARPDRRRGRRPATRPAPVGRPERRRRRLGAQRDLDRRDGRRSQRPAGAGDALVADRRDLGRRRPAASTSAQADVYYFAPQKCFASDGGLWLALLSPAAQERIGELDGSAAAGSPSSCRSRRRSRTRVKDQTYNTPARRDAVPARRPARVDARPAAGSTAASRARPRPPATSTAGPRRRRTRRRSSPTRPSARWSSARSTSTTASTPRRSPRRCAPTAIVDVEPYRKLGRNQLRDRRCSRPIEPDDVEALTACIDWIVAVRRGEAAS